MTQIELSKEQLELIYYLLIQTNKNLNWDNDTERYCSDDNLIICITMEYFKAMQGIITKITKELKEEEPYDNKINNTKIR